ncbi:MAG: hypothetical protein K0B06_07530 [Brevefilum sp.]|nr:hypothetical protein [Brevefilum sp.]
MNKIPYSFPGITVFVPQQVPEIGEIVAIDKKALIPKDLPKKTDNFRLIRVVANIVLYSKRDDDQYDGAKPIKKFNPPLEIRVGYTIEDVVENKGSFKKLKLAYWNGNKWVIFNNTEHEFHILPPDTGQVAEAKIKDWVGDPPIGWGR